MPLPSDTSSPEYIAARNAALSGVDLRGLDAGDPTTPCGLDYGLRVSTRLTSDFRATWRKQSMDIKPSEVMDCLRDAGVQMKEHVLEDGFTGHRYPTAEAAIVAKYAALISPSRKPAKRKYDAGDLESLIRTIHPNYDIAAIQSLASQVWEGGSGEILRFIDCALNEKPFPV